MIPRILFVLYLIVFTVCAFNPFARDVWFAENLAVWAVVIPLVIMYRKGIRFSNFAYIAMSVFIIMHTIGGHFTFERVPFDWFNNFFGFERNMYDRVAHFSVGFYALAVYEYVIMRKLIIKKKVAAVFALFTIVTVAAFHELFEWWYAVSSDPEAGIAVLGSQGDIWDAQKDMLADTLGALCVLGIVYTRTYFKKYTRKIGIAALILLTIIIVWARSNAQELPQCQDALDNVLKGELRGYAPFECTLKVSEHEKEIILSMYDREGNPVLEIRQGNTEIFSLGGSEENSIDVLSYQDEYTTVVPMALELQDVTYDGNLDLGVLVATGAYNYTYDIYAYNTETQTFDPIPLINDVTNPLFDWELGTITSFSKGRAIADIFISHVYEFKHGYYELAQEIEQNMIDWNNPEKGYVYIQKKLVNGNMVEVAREYFE